MYTDERSETYFVWGFNERGPFFHFCRGGLSQTLYEDNNVLFLPTITAMTHDSS